MTTAGRLNTALAPALQPLRAWYGQLAPRERLALKAAAWIVGLGALWMLAVQPAWRTLRATPARLQTLERQLQSMQVQAAEARELRALPALPRPQALAALRGAAERLGGATLVEQGDRVVVTLQAVSGQRLREWLGEVRASARARAVEAQLTRDDAGLSGTLILVLGAGEGS
ncbi:MAG: type II secretion system protein GspM [Rubrivivax sp.]